MRTLLFCLKWAMMTGRQEIAPMKHREYTEGQALRRAVLTLAGLAEPG